MGSLCSPLPVLFGAGGFVGRAIAAGMDVVPVTSRDCDLTERDDVMRLARRLDIRAPWILAAARSPDHPAPDEEKLRVNVAMAHLCLEMAQVARPSALLYFSSIDVYGRTRLTLPLHESSALEPESSYGLSKKVAEQVLREGCDTLGVPLAIFRLPGVYGPGDTHGGPVHRFVDAAVESKTICIFGDGEQVRDLLYVDDLVALVRAWCVEPKTGLWNVVSGRSVSLNYMLQILEGVTPEPLDVIYEAAAQYDITFRPSTIWSAFSVTPTPIETGLRETYTRQRGSAPGH